jgi:ribosomal-protein-alanine N-acetyltransferase
MKPPIIETERLILRPLKTSDAEHIFKTWASDPRVTKYMLYTTHENSQVTYEWLKSVEEGESGPDYDWGFELKSTGQLIGSGGLAYHADEDAYAVGYNLAYDYWHQGYAPEAAKAFVAYFKSVGGKKIFSRHALENENSGKVMKKIGMHYVCDSTMTKFDGTVLPVKKYEMDL